MLSSLYASVPRLAMSVTRYRLALIAALSALAPGARHRAPASTAGPVTGREGARCGLLSVCGWRGPRTGNSRAVSTPSTSKLHTRALCCTAAPRGRRPCPGTDSACLPRLGSTGAV
jgi:hypothetical protein